MIRIHKYITVPEEELTITAARSSGPGGQNVNKVSTKVTLRFNIAGTSSMTAAQKARVINKLRKMVNRKGDLVIHEETRRSQAANRKRVIEKFAEMMDRALTIPKKRIPTAVSRAQKEKRRDEKKIQSRKKRNRRRDAAP